MQSQTKQRVGICIGKQNWKPEYAYLYCGKLTGAIVFIIQDGNEKMERKETTKRTFDVDSPKLAYSI